MPVDFSEIEQKILGYDVRFVSVDTFPLTDRPNTGIIQFIEVLFGDFIEPYSQGCSSPSQVYDSLEATLMDLDSRLDNVNRTDNAGVALSLSRFEVLLLRAKLLIQQHYLQGAYSQQEKIRRIA